MKRFVTGLVLLAALGACSRSEPEADANATRQDANAAKTGEEMTEGSVPSTATEWQTLPNGIRYRRTRGDGSGRKPTIASRVTVHYVGMLPDGTVFDSSIERGEPATFSLTRVVEGWQQVIPMMGAGDIYEFYLPPALGYGAEGSPPTIPPNATLFFRVALLVVHD